MGECEKKCKNDSVSNTLLQASIEFDSRFKVYNIQSFLKRILDVEFTTSSGNMFQVDTTRLKHFFSFIKSIGCFFKLKSVTSSRYSSI